MLKDEFYQWLIYKYDNQGTARSRLSNCLTVCNHEGDLDEHYDRDACSELIEKLTYTAEDEAYRRKPQHKIPINGNIKNGTATLKNAVGLYIEFRKSFEIQIKSKEDADMNIAMQLANNSQHVDILRLPAAVVVQGQLKLYATSLTVRDLLINGFYSVNRLDPSGESKGFQRLLNQSRAKNLARYIVESLDEADAFLPTSIFLATDKDIPYDDKYHTIEIDIKKLCPFNVVDGQHRVEGLRMAAEQDNRTLDFTIPVNIAVNLNELSQMTHFLIVNTTQKSVDRAVEQRIYQRLTKKIELENLPSLPRWIRKIVEKGEIDKALMYVDHLAKSEGSPWIGKINMANSTDKRGTLNQQSFVQAINKHVLIASNQIPMAFHDKEYEIFKNYWIAIHNVISADSDSVLFKYNGCFLFCMFSVPFLMQMLSKKTFKIDAMEDLLQKTFDCLDGDFAGIRHADYWTKGGPASFMNVGGLNNINKAMIEALHKADTQDSGNIEI